MFRRWEHPTVFISLQRVCTKWYKMHFPGPDGCALSFKGLSRLAWVMIGSWGTVGVVLRIEMMLLKSHFMKMAADRAWS